MPTHNFATPRGRVETIEIDSDALAGNLIGDPRRRATAVYLPEGYDVGDDRLPLLVGLAPYTGSGLKMLAWQSFGESLPQRLDRLIARGKLGPLVLALPDGFTSLGGNQYVDSPATGRWEAYLLDELLPELERRYRILPGARHRALFGRSSGGYGALIHALRHGERWGAVACHSSDVGFDLLYRAELPRALDALARHGGDIEAFLGALGDSPRIDGGEFHALMVLAMAASYDPDPERPLGIRLPVDPDTCQIDEGRWAAWLAHDPLTLIDRPECRASLRRLSGLFLDCGSRDPYFLHYGNRALARKLTELGIEHVYEEFDDGHSGIDYRLDRSLPWLWERIRP